MPEPDHMGHILEQRVAADPHEREDTQRDQRYGHNDLVVRSTGSHLTSG